MLRWISILEGLLTMMGHRARSELCYCFRPEDQVPETHLLRLIDKHISFAFVREQLRDSYSEAGRPRSIPNSCCACDGTTWACNLAFSPVPYRALQSDRCLVITT